MLDYWVWECDWGKEKTDDLRKEDQNNSLKPAHILNYVENVVHLSRTDVFIFA